MFLKLAAFALFVITLTAVTPNHGKQGDVIKLDATGYPRVSRVMVGRNLCGTLRRTDVAIYCIVPPGTGTVDVSIHPQGDAPVVLEDAFTYDQ